MAKSDATPPRLYIDFDELVGPGLVALSARDTVLDDAGAVVGLTEGLAVRLYSFDIDDDGKSQRRHAGGRVELNESDGGGLIKWVCRIDAAGIRVEVDKEG